MCFSWQLVATCGTEWGRKTKHDVTQHYSLSRVRDFHQQRWLLTGVFTSSEAQNECCILSLVCWIQVNPSVLSLCSSLFSATLRSRGGRETAGARFLSVLRVLVCDLRNHLREQDQAENPSYQESRSFYWWLHNAAGLSELANLISL